jgi:hypothetical protein
MLSISQVNFFTVKKKITPDDLSGELKELNLKLFNVNNLSDIQITNLYEMQCETGEYFIFAEDKYLGLSYEENEEKTKIWQGRVFTSKASESQEMWAANCVFVVTNITSTGSG